MNPEWDADTYHRVSEPQAAWGHRVLGRLSLRGDERVIDLGCGSGRLTAQLAARVPNGAVIGLDRSSQMLLRARRHLRDSGYSRVHVVLAALPAIPVRNWADLAFSTATFHWVHDHEALFANVFTALKPGGRLVAQCGGDGNLRSFHRLALDVAFSGRFSRWFEPWSEPWEFADASTTRARLNTAGFVEIDAWLEDAPTPFPDVASFRDFVRTAVLRPMLARLPDDAQREAYLTTVVQEASHGQSPLVLDYRRLNLSARRPEEPAP